MSWRSDLNRRPIVYKTIALPLSYASLKSCPTRFAGKARYFPGRIQRRVNRPERPKVHQALRFPKRNLWRKKSSPNFGSSSRTAL